MQNFIYGKYSKKKPKISSLHNCQKKKKRVESYLEICSCLSLILFPCLKTFSYKIKFQERDTCLITPVESLELLPGVSREV